jgi:hypothetical protein
MVVRLLILGCSQRKSPEPGLLPALERYDGPAFRVLRKFMRNSPPQASRTLGIHILSAEFGLISAYQRIPHYDQRMTLQRAIQLQPQVLEEFSGLLQNLGCRELLISLGRDYVTAIDGYAQLVPSGVNIIIASGTIGRRLATLHDWLYGNRPSVRPSGGVFASGKARVRGVSLELTQQQVLTAARRGLQARRGDPYHFQSWYVSVDGQQVSPKWLVSQLTQLPLSDFTTDEARRVLSQLGIEVMRV